MGIQFNKLLAVAAVTAAAATSASATSLDYSVSNISGSWAWGQTQWNDEAGLGYVNNATDLAAVEAILEGAYVYQAPHAQVANGIYNWPSNGSVTFQTGALSTLNTLSILSSRSYSSSTSISVDYSADGGASWTQAFSSTTGAMGWVDVGTAGSATELINIALGGVYGNALRFNVVGDQVSLHTVTLDGSTTAVPEPESYALMLLGLGLVAAAKRRQRKA